MTKEKYKKSLGQVSIRLLLLILLCTLVVITIIPFYSMFVMSTYSSYKLFSFNGLPSNYLMENFKTIAGTKMNVFFKNSLIMAAASVVFGGLSCTMCGYGLAKYNFKGRKTLLKVVILTMMIPSQLSLVAYVWEMRVMGLNNTLIPSIIPFLFMGFGAFWMNQYIGGAIPNEIIESARVDGAGEITIFIKLVLPLITPAIMTLSLLIFVWSWNGFLIPLITINKPELYSLPLGIASFNGMYQTDNGAKILALSLATLPVILVYLFASNRLIGGLTMGAVKG